MPFANNETLLTVGDGAASDYFGYSVSINDAGVVTVGAYLDDDTGASSGSVYVYSPDGSGGYVQTAKLTADDGRSFDNFGYSVSINDAGVVTVGAYGDDDKGSASGSVYVFSPDGSGEYEQTAKLTADDGAAEDYFGSSVSINDAGVVTVGAEFDDDKATNSGSAYVFSPDGNGGYEQTAKLTADDGAASDRFGNSVSINDAGVVTVGAYWDDHSDFNSGSAYVFSPDGNGGYVQTAKLTADDGAAEDYFGVSVSINDAGVVTVGAYGDDDNSTDSGSAYVFSPDGNGSYEQTAKLTADDGAAEDYFGASVSINDAGVVTVGANWDDDKGTNSGSAYVFSPDGSGEYEQTAKLTADDGAAGDHFGVSVSSNNANDVAIGANLDDVNGIADAGSVSVFDGDVVSVRPRPPTETHRTW